MDSGGVRSFDEGATGMDELHYELWHACAGPLTSLPPLESLVMYWPQGHIEQVVACTPDSEVPDVFEASKQFQLPSHLLCKISEIELLADPQTDDVFAQMDLIPQNESQVTKEMREAPPPAKQTNVRSFCKTDCNMNPPCQELVAKDLHGKEWNFRHIYRGHPPRHHLTTGWGAFVSQKRLVAGDTVIFLRGQDGQLRVGIRRASKQLQRSTYFCSANVHLGVLAAASQAANENIRLSVIYNPTSSPSEFVIPYHKYLEAEECNFTVGSRFRLKFESDESTKRRYSGTITEIGDADPLKWPESAWRCMKVEWDESVSGERPDRVSPWEIKPFVPISTLPTPPVGPTHKRGPASPLPHLSPLGSRQSVMDSLQPNRLAGILQVGDPASESGSGGQEDGDAEPSRNSSWALKQEAPLRTGPHTWFPRPDAPSDVMAATPYPHSPRLTSVTPVPTSPAVGTTLPRSVGHEIVNTCPAVVRQCMLFGFNLADKAAPVPGPSAPSHGDDSEGLGTYCSTEKRHKGSSMNVYRA